MAASREDIDRWFGQGIAEGATHLIVVCDTFDYDDYPVYVMPGEDARHKHTELHGSNMRKVMEVYALHLDKAQQMAEWRSFHYETLESEHPTAEWQQAVADGKTLLGFQAWIAMWETPIGQRVKRKKHE